MVLISETINVNSPIVGANFSPNNFNDYYFQDQWDLFAHPSWNKLTEAQKTFVTGRGVRWLEFPVGGNKKINIELKYFCSDLLESNHYSLTTMSTNFYSVGLISEYIASNFLQISSITDIPLETLTSGFSSHLSENGFKTSIEYSWAVNKKMEKPVHKTSSIPLRFLSQLYKFIKKCSYSEQPVNEFFNDIWDIRNMNFVQGFDESRPRYTINFTKIYQEPIRYITKRYTWQRLETGKKLSTCLSDLKGMLLLSLFLKNNFITIQSLAELNRNILEGFLRFVELNSGLCERQKAARIGSLKTFFETCQINNWETSPLSTLILSSDISFKTKTLPRPISQYVLQQLNQHIHELPPQITRMVIIVQRIGMRVNELCKLQIDCIKSDSNGEPYIRYFQTKTKKLNSVPVEIEFANIILDAIDASKIEFGENIKFVFSQNKEKPISQDKFANHLNRLSLEKQIREADGNLFRFESHQFRHTHGSELINQGLDLVLVSELMGWSDVFTANYYLELFEGTVVTAMQPLINKYDEMISNIGKTYDFVSPSASIGKQSVPLVNGWCCKTDLCEKCGQGYGGYCYSCQSFISIVEHLPLYKSRYKELYKSLQNAKNDGNDRFCEILEPMVIGLKGVIVEIERKIDGAHA